MTTKATYCKLRDGSWGIRGGANLKEGARVLVSKKDGTTKAETVGRIIWSKDGVRIAALTRSGSARGERGRCANCGDACNPRYRLCLSCVEGGDRYCGGMSYYDSDGNFVLGEDD